jgi:hypothetical protein
MAKFSDQLLTDLMTEHGAALRAPGPLAGPGRRPHALRRGALLAGGAGTLAAGLTAGLTAFGGGASPAYAVTQHPDGTLTVALTSASGIAGANQTLRSLNARVVVVPERAGCPSITSLPAPAVAMKAQIMDSLQIDKESATVNAHGIPAGDLLVLAVSSTGNAVRVSSALTSPPAPGCVSVPAAGPGSGGNSIVRNKNGAGRPVRVPDGAGNTVRDTNGGGSAPAKVEPPGGQPAGRAGG